MALVWPGRPADAASLLDVVLAEYRPNLVMAGAREGEGADLTPLLAERGALQGRATAYVCERFACQTPTSDPEILRAQLAAGS